MPDLDCPEIDLSQANGSASLPETCGAGGDEQCQYSYSDPTLPGTLHSRGSESPQWATSYNLHAGGPIIKDKLFVFASAVWNENEAVNAPTAFAAAPVRSRHTPPDIPRLYAKLDWSTRHNPFPAANYLNRKARRE